jgi:hypothetical protein
MTVALEIARMDHDVTPPNAAQGRGSSEDRTDRRMPVVRIRIGEVE